jgi:hypothetical protein
MQYIATINYKLIFFHRLQQIIQAMRQHESFSKFTAQQQEQYAIQMLLKLPALNNAVPTTAVLQQQLAAMQAASTGHTQAAMAQPVSSQV